MIGHSLGEYVAACVAGVFDVADALRLVVERARLISAVGHGAMLAVPMAEDDVRAYLTDDVSVAAVNDPGTCVLSGPEAAIEGLVARLRDSGVVSRRLNTRFAFHSPAMDTIADAYADIVRTVRLNPPRIPFVSNISGTWITDAEATDPGYWARHLRQPVRFADGMATVWKLPEVVLVEVGPGGALGSAALHHAGAAPTDRVVVRSLPDAFTAGSARGTLLRSLARLWLAGVTPSWDRLHPVGARRRLPLPTYPFSRVRYWLEPGAVPALTEQGRAALDDWFYDVSWRRLEPVERSDDLAGRVWLVFLDEGGVGARVASRLAGRGVSVVTVAVGTRWEAVRPDHYVLDPAVAEHYRWLAETLRAAGSVPDRVVHCWTADPGPVSDEPTVAHGELNRGFFSLVRWAQAVGPELMVTPQRWDVVSSEVFAVLGDEPVNPVKATIQGVCRVASQEYPSLRCRQLDLPPPGSGPVDLDALADRVLLELASPADGGAVALRGAGRWAQQPVPAPLTAVQTPTIRPDGVYLITGGLGRVGLVLARAIAEAAPGARLVLVGRTGLPEQENAEHECDSVARARRAVRQLEAAGARVLVGAADVADPVAMADLLDRVKSEFGPVNGVIHAAGSTGPAAHRVLAELTDEECFRHFDSKLHGVHVLDRLLAGQPLDFAVFCSSVAALLGGLGFTAYAAANAFLDAHARRVVPPDGVRWTSLNWEAWHFADDADPGVGIGAAVHKVAMSPDEGRAVFERVLASVARPQVIVSTTDLPLRVSQWTAPVRDAEPPGRRHARPTLVNPYVEPATDLERQLAGIWSEVLGVAQVGVHDNFFELGGSSLLGLQVVHRLRSELRRAVPLTVVYEGPTVRSLARLLEEIE